MERESQMGMKVKQPEIEICPHCGEPIAPNGYDAVYPHGTEHRYHDECFKQVGFRCGDCEDWFLNEELRYLAVVRKVEGVQRGVYRIVKIPFYADGIVEAHLYRNALRRDGHIIGTEPREYPVCLLCPECAARHGVRRTSGKEN